MIEIQIVEDIHYQYYYENLFEHERRQNLHNSRKYF